MHCHFGFFGFGDFIGREGVAIGAFVVAAGELDITTGEFVTGELMVAAGLLLNFGFFGFGEFVGGGGGLAIGAFVVTTGELVINTGELLTGELEVTAGFLLIGAVTVGGGPTFIGAFVITGKIVVATGS